MFSEWGRVDVAPDMVFTVEVTRLDGPSGEKLFESNWDEGDEERLAALIEEFGPGSPTPSEAASGP